MSLTKLTFVVDDLLALVKEYFERFGSKACCFDDLHPYVQVLHEDEKKSFCEVLLQTSTAEMKVC